jgi:hypothetical protein
MKNYDKNFLKWLGDIRERFKVPLFLLVFATVIFGMGFMINRLISSS